MPPRHREPRISSTILEKIKPRVQLVEYIRDSPRIIASAGKQTISPKPFNEILGKMDSVKTQKWIKELVRRGHGSPLEHSIYIFHVTCSRVASHQLVRHRIASYTQLSQRYSDKYLVRLVERIRRLLGAGQGREPPGSHKYTAYSETIKQYISTNPSYIELLEVVSEAFIVPPSILVSRNKEYLAGLLNSVAIYYELLSQGVSYEDARFILPQSVKTQILVSMNARELVENFLPLRMCSHAQWEIRCIAWSLWRSLAKVHPQLFMYTGPRCVLYENRIRDEPCSLPSFIDGKCGFTINRCPELVPRDGIRNCLLNASRDPWSIIGGD